MYQSVSICKLLKLFVFCVIIVPNLGNAQDSFVEAPKFEVNRVYPPVSITKENLKEALTIIDLNSNYDSSWVKEYLSVEIITKLNGETSTVIAKNNILSQEQKDVMNAADLGANIAVKVLYMPKNTLSSNDTKEIFFSFTVIPENEAQYYGGEKELRLYLDKAIEKIPSGSFQGYDLSAIQFSVNESGQIIDVHVFNSSNNETVDQLLLESISTMPNWKPAEYSNGLKVEQDFVLTVGNMENCIIHLLNIKSE